jgi:hypothetical protein
LMLAEDLGHCGGWVDFAGSRCFQIMEAQKPSLRWRSGEERGRIWSNSRLSLSRPLSTSGQKQFRCAIHCEAP